MQRIVDNTIIGYINMLPALGHDTDAGHIEKRELKDKNIKIKCAALSN